MSAPANPITPVNPPASVRPVLVMIVGPTGSGKSDLAVALAAHLEAPVISADSRQVYKGMRIGTAQPAAEQLNAVPHYFVADRPPTERFTCADFEREGLALLDKLFAEQVRTGSQRPPYVVGAGGSGLYIDALCHGLDAIPDIDPALRKDLTGRLSGEGLEPLLELLREKDPVIYETIDRRNRARVIRALEVCLRTGKPFSELRTGAKASRPFDIVKIGIDLPRPELYARIDRRVDAMMEAGLEGEARELYPLRHFPALRTVGYSELFDHFDSLRSGTPDPEKSLARAVELIKRNSRRYAKRQMTWLRRDPDIRWLTPAQDTSRNLVDRALAACNLH